MLDFGFFGSYTSNDDENNDKILPLDVTLKSQFERVFGSDFSNVKIHIGHYSDRLTREAGAFAVTIGNDIYFANGQYSPETISGIKLLAHELQHVVQYQNNRSVQYDEDITALESEASEIEMLFDTLMLHDISAPIVDQTSISQIDQSEAANKASAGLKKSTTDEQLVGLDKFVQKDKSFGYKLTLPSKKQIELSVEEYAVLQHILKKEIIKYIETQKNMLTIEEWERFVIKLVKFLRK